LFGFCFSENYCSKKGKNEIWLIARNRKNKNKKRIWSFLANHPKYALNYSYIREKKATEN
jgi:hypothetical protein